MYRSTSDGSTTTPLTTTSSIARFMPAGQAGRARQVVRRRGRAGGQHADERPAWEASAPAGAVDSSKWALELSHQPTGRPSLQQTAHMPACAASPDTCSAPSPAARQPRTLLAIHQAALHGRGSRGEELLSHHHPNLLVDQHAFAVGVDARPPRPPRHLPVAAGRETRRRGRGSQSRYRKRCKRTAGSAGSCQPRQAGWPPAAAGHARSAHQVPSMTLAERPL